MNKSRQRLKYIFMDIISAALSWTAFFVFRKRIIESKIYGVIPDVHFNSKFFISVSVITLLWLFIYFISGYYQEPYRKGRLKELEQTVLSSIIGCIIIFFVFILDDEIINYKTYYKSLFALFSFHFLFTYPLRFIITNATVYKIHSRLIGFNTLIIGGSTNAVGLLKELGSLKKGLGFNFHGYVNIPDTNGNGNGNGDMPLRHLGSIKQVSEIIEVYDIEEVIIAIESNEHMVIEDIMKFLAPEQITIKIIPDMYNILSGQVKMNAIFGVPLMEVNQDLMPVWQKVTKRVMDVTISIFVFICFSWLFLLIAFLVKLSSKGPIIYSHERIGKDGRPFMIYKFRSMYVDAEKSGPSLSSTNDPRITRFGKFLRKSRLDEIPQFYNVLKADMSMVGPRPERQYFIDKIMEKAPHYRFLKKVQPGITSWGQVKYGYAENVDEMIARLKYDVIYIENMSIFVDLKIIIYTVLIVIQGRGK